MPPISFPSDPPAPLRLGVCYYPEQWPKARWREDARAMRALGLGTVRIAEFAWSRMEPAPGQFDWAWLDEAIDVLADESLSVVLGTPTAAPPQWLVEAHPDVLPVGADGRVKPFGARRHYCFSSPSLHKAGDGVKPRRRGECWLKSGAIGNTPAAASVLGMGCSGSHSSDCGATTQSS